MIISSQRYLDNDIVKQKILTIENEVNIPVVFVGEWQGEKLYAIVDGHHTQDAALQTGAKINYVETSGNNYDSRWTLEDYLENLYIDSDWYNIETGEPIF